MKTFTERKQSLIAAQIFSQTPIILLQSGEDLTQVN